LQGVRIGIDRNWIRGADSDVRAACDELLAGFVRQGAELAEVEIPDLRLIAVAHAVTILSEMANNMSRYEREHGREFALTTRLMLATTKTLRASDYVQAQRMRTRAIGHFRAALTRVEVIATPTAPRTAPEIRGSALPEGEANLSQTMEIMRFIHPANLTGLPAISVPAGYDRRGLPVGLQLIGRPWEESTLFRLAYAAESSVRRRRPPVWFDLLPELCT
jgi:Asp-tRNA(Asn)/Glu-tRNA(Gln) amidotransferase A subunit family amidase